MTAVWDEATELEGTSLLVALCIADHAQDESGEAWPSVARICARVRRSERAVFRALETIEEAGWVERITRPGQSNVYRLHRPTPATSDTPAESAPLSPASPTPDASVTPPLPPASPITIKEPPLEPDAAPDQVGREPAAAVSQVCDRPFPIVEQRKLVSWFSVPATSGPAWEAAWEAAIGITSTDVEYDPQAHLAIYLSRCREERRQPRSDLWLRFFIEDRAKHIVVLREEAEMVDHHHETPQEREDRMNKPLPPADWGVPAAAPETGEQA
jgi:hypothetical protein